MALEGWDWFIKLAENENFTKAADELQISQQTLSARLVSLERNLGAKLVVRGTPISLTSAGKVFLLYAREQRQAQQDMIRQIGEVAGGGRVEGGHFPHTRKLSYAQGDSSSFRRAACGYREAHRRYQS